MARDVMCKVENCQFYSQGDRCNANAIEVNVDGGGKQAGDTGETNCNTFTEKNR